MDKAPKRPDAATGEPGRQGNTMGWWGWFPNIPRNLFGRVCWLAIVGAVTAGFLLLAVIMGWNLVSALLDGGVDTSVVLTVVMIVLCLVGTLVFGNELYRGAQQARIDDLRKRALKACAQRAEATVQEARHRLKR